MEAPSLHTIVEEPYFAMQLRRIHADAARADEFLEGVQWVLARNPAYGCQVSENVWMIPTADSAEGVAMNVYYTFNEHSVYLIAIEVAP